MQTIISSIAILLLSINVLVLNYRLTVMRKAISAIMELIIRKWTFEAHVNQVQIDAMIEDTINKIREQDK